MRGAIIEQLYSVFHGYRRRRVRGAIVEQLYSECFVFTDVDECEVPSLNNCTQCFMFTDVDECEVPSLNNCTQSVSCLQT